MHAELQTNTSYRLICMDVYLNILGEPITDQNVVIEIRARERRRNLCSVVDSDGTKPAGGLVKVKRREIEVTADLIFELKTVSPVLSRRYRTIGSLYSILP